MGRRLRYQPFTEEQKTFILDNYKVKTVQEMTRELKMGFIDRRVYRFLDERDLPSLEKVRKKRKRVPEGMFDDSVKDWFI